MLHRHSTRVAIVAAVLPHGPPLSLAEVGPHFFRGMSTSRASFNCFCSVTRTGILVRGGHATSIRQELGHGRRPDAGGNLRKSGLNHRVRGDKCRRGRQRSRGTVSTATSRSQSWGRFGGGLESLCDLVQSSGVQNPSEIPLQSNSVLAPTNLRSPCSGEGCPP